MRQSLVAGNWKLNGSKADNARLVEGIVEGLGGTPACDVVVCPPFVYLGDVLGLLGGSPVRLGAQSVSAEVSGAFTGEVSAAMLRDIGCSHVIVGHSERRAGYGESDALVARKFAAACAAGLSPILCVGELPEEREQGITRDVIARQLTAVLDEVGVSSLAGSVVAYEPVWAIGTGRTATPEQAQEVHAHIRSIVAARDARIAADLRILYGGSVKGSNAAELFAMEDIDGGLIGGASLDPAEFVTICNSATETDQ